MNIRLDQLVEVSNNSRITQSIDTIINNKLDDTEKHIFLEWLRLIRDKQNHTPHNSKWG